MNLWHLETDLLWNEMAALRRISHDFFSYRRSKSLNAKKTIEYFSALPEHPLSPFPFPQPLSFHRRFKDVH